MNRLIWTLGLGMLLMTACSGDDSSSGVSDGDVGFTKRGPNGINPDKAGTLSYVLTNYEKAQTPTSGSYFGLDVAIHEDVAVIGATYAVFQTGSDFNWSPAGGQYEAVYVYRKTNGAWAYEATLEPSDQETTCTSWGSDCMSFGQAVDTNGDVIVVGASDRDDGATSSAGGVYVYRYEDGEWTEEQTLIATTPVASDQLGYDVALSEDGTRIVAGVPGRSSNQGAVVVYEYASGTWSEDDELTQGSGTQDLGMQVAISEDGLTVAASRPYESTYTGSVDVWQNDGSSWSHEQQVEASDETTWVMFGTALALDDNILAVGTYQTDSDTGSVYIYRYDSSNTTWDEEAILEPENISTNDQFGFALDLHNGILVASANLDDSGRLTRLETGTTQGGENPDNEHHSGAVYVFENTSGTTWEETGYLKAPNAEMDDVFGTSVAVVDGIIVVGAPLEDGAGTDWTDQDDNELDAAGAAYFFKPFSEL